jgi:hypothetical protein
MEGCIRDQVAIFSGTAFSNPIPFALARQSNRNPHHYVLTQASGYRQPFVRYLTTLNPSAPPNEPLERSSAGRPLLWIEPDVEVTKAGTRGSTLDALLGLNRAPFRFTGRTRRRHGDDSGDEVREAELLLTEDELLRACCYCGLLENANYVLSDRFARCGGEAYASRYWCEEVGAQWSF